MGNRRAWVTLWVTNSPESSSNRGIWAYRIARIYWPRRLAGGLRSRWALSPWGFESLRPHCRPRRTLPRLRRGLAGDHPAGVERREEVRRLVGSEPFVVVVVLDIAA